MNKKLSQLTEKSVSLDPNDLMLVSTGGESKSVKVSTLEAPLKSYTDSAVSSESSSRQSAISQEISDRLAGDASTLASAESYTDSEILAEQTARISGDQDTLTQANAYVDSSLVALNYNPSAITQLQADLADQASDMQLGFANSFIDMQNYVADQIAALPNNSAAISALESDITTESERITTLESTVNVQNIYLDGQVSLVQTSISNEISRASAAEGSIQSALSAEISRAQAAESSLSSQISSLSGGGNTSFPVGSMMVYAGATAPTGWLLCDGSAVSRTTYSGLFTVISSSFGSGDGSTTFNLPNPDVNANLKYIIKT